MMLTFRSQRVNFFYMLERVVRGEGGSKGPLMLMDLDENQLQGEKKSGKSPGQWLEEGSMVL